MTMLFTVLPLYIHANYLLIGIAIKGKLNIKHY